MAIRTNLLGAGSPLLPSSAPNPTTAATDLAAVAVPLPRDSDRGIDPAAGALCLVRSNERDGLAAAGETSGGGFFPPLAGGLILVFASVGFSIAVVRFARWLGTRSAPKPPLLPGPLQPDDSAGLRLSWPHVRTIEMMGEQVLRGRNAGNAIVLERVTDAGVASIAICVFPRELFEKAIVPAMAQFPGGKVS